MPSGIYQIACSANGKVYVGSALVLSRRKAQHFNRLRAGVHNSRHLQNAWNKYGQSAFHFSMLCECSPEDLERLEAEAIRNVPQSRLFNVRLSVETNRGTKWSAESRARIAGRKFSAEAYKKRAEIGVTPRQRESYKNRRRSKGGGRPRGFHHSEETRRKIGAGQPKKKAPMTQERRLAAIAILEKYHNCPDRIARSAAAHKGKRRFGKALANILASLRRRRYGTGTGQLSLW